MILYNNDFVSRDDVHVEIEDRGYQFGDGIYEVIRIYNGQFFLGDEHLKRLERSAKEISLDLPYGLDQLKENLKKLVDEDGLSEGIIYLQITRGVAPRSHPFPDQSLPILTAYTKEMKRPVSDMEKGVKALLVEDIRWLRCDIKSLNLLGNILAKQEAKEQNYSEAILHRGHTITEGSSTNVFGVRKGQIITHPTTNLILPGITRQKVIDLASEKGYAINEQEMTIRELLDMDEVFLTSTTMEVTPVIQIDHEIIGDGQKGPVTTELQLAFSESIKKDL